MNTPPGAFIFNLRFPRNAKRSRSHFRGSLQRVAVRGTDVVGEGPPLRAFPDCAVPNPHQQLLRSGQVLHRRHGPRRDDALRRQLPELSDGVHEIGTTADTNLLALGKEKVLGARAAVQQTPNLSLAVPYDSR